MCGTKPYSVFHLGVAFFTGAMCSVDNFHKFKAQVFKVRVSNPKMMACVDLNMLFESSGKVWTHFCVSNAQTPNRK